MSSPEDWFRTLPPVTKFCFCVAVSTTVLISIGLMSEYYLFMDKSFAIDKFQIWRLFSNFIFFGSFSIGFVFNIVLLVRYLNELESSYFAGIAGAADLTFVLLFGMLCMDLVALIWPIYFMGPSLIFFIIYVWSRKDPYRQVIFYGFTFSQWHTPFLFLGVSVLIGNSLTTDLLGIAVGHLYYFLSEVVPRVYGWTIIRTPTFLYAVFNKYLPQLAGMRTNFAAPGQVQQPQRPQWMRGPGHRLDG